MKPVLFLLIGALGCGEQAYQVARDGCVMLDREPSHRDSFGGAMDKLAVERGEGGGVVLSTQTRIELRTGTGEPNYQWNMVKVLGGPHSGRVGFLRGECILPLD